jgi:hypothetical protein
MSNTQVAIDAIHQLAIADEEIQKLRAENKALRESLIYEKYQSAELLCEVSELKTKLAMLYEPLTDEELKNLSRQDLRGWYVDAIFKEIHQAILSRIEEE